MKADAITTGRARACPGPRRPVTKGHAAARPLPYEGGGALISSKRRDDRSINSTKTDRNVRTSTTSTKKIRRDQGPTRCRALVLVAQQAHWKFVYR